MMLGGSSMQTALVLFSIGMIMQVLGQQTSCRTDFNPSCRADNPMSHVFPPNWVILMDTHDFRTLFNPSHSCDIWKTREYDLGPSQSDGNTVSS